jgi:hypothetical protein
MERLLGLLGFARACACCVVRVFCMPYPDPCMPYLTYTSKCRTFYFVYVFRYIICVLYMSRVIRVIRNIIIACLSAFSVYIFMHE